MIDALATMPHYAHHLAPIWWALPAERRGRFYAAGALEHCQDGEGLPGWKYGYPPDHGRPCLVAGYVDEISANRPTIYVEHGAGQTYSLTPAEQDKGAAYSGSAGHHRTILFICPGETVARRWRDAYPGVPAVAVGCPRLDGWHRRQHQPGGKVVAFTFHSRSPTCPEARTAFDHYQEQLPAVVEQLRHRGWTVIGHGHPRLWREIGPYWRRIGVEAVQSFDEVLGRARVLCVDNTSAGPEFASTGRPVVWMNAPWYRRTVEHGGRFWEWPEGQPTVDNPDELPAAIEEADDDLTAHRQARQRMVDGIYAACDGNASERAAQSILAALDTRVVGFHAQWKPDTRP